LKIDLHVHSKYSWDSKVEIIDYIKRAEEIGLGAIAITDHDNTESHNEIKDLQQDTSVILVPGQEVSTSNGHLLVYGWVDTLPPKVNMNETIKIAKSINHDAICIPAHSFDPLRKGIGHKILDFEIDGLEVQNGGALFGYYNYKAKKHMNKVKISLGNSDAHRVEEIGFSYSIIPDVSSVEELFAKLPEAVPYGKSIGLWRKSKRFVIRKFKH
jgi:predicted metal-dependent phosphoesterase TrpH